MTCNEGPLVAGIALGQEGTGVGRLRRLMCHCGCYLSAPLFLVLVHPAQLGVFLFHSYSAKQVRSLLVSVIQVALNEQLWTMWSSF